MKKILALSLSLAMLAGLLSGCGSDSEETVSVESVSMITGYGSVGTISRYAGKVVSGNTAEIKKDENKTVKEVMVEVGDWVNEGDVLFTYDSDAMELSLTKLELEIEGYASTITSAQEELPQLQELRDSTTGSQQLGYSLQIQTLQADIREAEYNKALKERELELMRASMDSTEVTSPITGRVMTVNNGDSSGGGDYYGEEISSAFITVMDMTSYRVEGKINEMNVGTLTVGMDVIIRSRLDETVVWHGTLDSIDWEKGSTQSDSNMYYYGYSSDETTQSTKYPFYVTPDSNDGMILGQHVYVEPDYGQTAEDEGLWLPAMYIADADSSPYVWAQNSRSKLEKRSLTLGEYDGLQDRYLVTDGLTAEDYIAFPVEGLSVGMTTVAYDESSFGGDAAGDGYYGETMPEGEYYEEAVPMPDIATEEAEAPAAEG